MHKILVAGAGKIGSLIACLLADSGSYLVHLADAHFAGADAERLQQVMPYIKTKQLDVTKHPLCCEYVAKHKIEAIVSCLPYFLNIHLAKVAKACNCHYFDLTEDTATATAVKILSMDAQKAFVPQCGLAPGFVNIVANCLIQEFDVCHYAKLRVGALPQRTSNGLNYSLTWSTDGLINEYGNPCFGLEAGQVVTLAPLEGLELIQLDGCEYEAFNTSGGVGSLVEIFQEKVQTLNYKTMRYPGHSAKMQFLMNDLKLNEDRETLKRILERAIPKTLQDMVIVYVAVEGIKRGELMESSYMKKIYPQEIHCLPWSAIQVATASGLCAVLDTILSQEALYRGLVLQESIPLEHIVNNRFGKCFA